MFYLVDEPMTILTIRSMGRCSPLQLASNLQLLWAQCIRRRTAHFTQRDGSKLGYLCCWAWLGETKALGVPASVASSHVR